MIRDVSVCVCQKERVRHGGREAKSPVKVQYPAWLYRSIDHISGSYVSNAKLSYTPEVRHFPREPIKISIHEQNFPY